MPRFPRCLASALAALALAGCAQAPVDQPAVAAFTPTKHPDQARKTCDKPVWPAEALRARYTGITTVSFLIGTDGWVRDTKILKSSGHPVLDNAAESALRRCQFKPAVKNGEPVETWVPVQYRWELK
jgi:protein TonB